MNPSSLLGEVILGVLLFYLTPKEDFLHLGAAYSIKNLCINFALFSQYPASSTGGSGKLL